VRVGKDPISRRTLTFSCPQEQTQSRLQLKPVQSDGQRFIRKDVSTGRMLAETRCDQLPIDSRSSSAWNS
jgi:hypothetical protein